MIRRNRILLLFGLVALVMLFGVVFWSLFRPWNRQIAEKSAQREIYQYAKDYHLSRIALGQPAYVSGNDKDGYLFYWNIHSKKEGAEKAGDIIVGIGKHYSNVSITVPLDCRPGLDQQTRAKGLGYLCTIEEKK